MERYHIEVPPPLPGTSSRKELRAENLMLRDIILQAGIALEEDYAQIKLMDLENERLRKQAFRKVKQKNQNRLTSGHARHMTAAESLDLLARQDWERWMNDVFKEAAPRFKVLKKNIIDHLKAIEKARKAAEQTAKKAATAAARAERARGRGTRGGRRGGGRGARGRGAAVPAAEASCAGADADAGDSDSEPSGVTESSKSDSDTNSDSEVEIPVPQLRRQRQIRVIQGRCEEPSVQSNKR